MRLGAFSSKREISEVKVDEGDGRDEGDEGDGRDEGGGRTESADKQ